LRVYVGDSELVSALLEYFERQADCVAVQVAETEIEVSLLGSYSGTSHDAAVERLVTDFDARRNGLPSLRLRNGR
jgi:ribosomal protein S12 methylthiotransferase accessory factor YcaO